MGGAKENGAAEDGAADDGGGAGRRGVEKERGRRKTKKKAT